MLDLVWSRRFKKDYTRAIAQGKDLRKLDILLEYLMNDAPLPANYKDHSLKGEWSHYRDAHIEFDWILIYRVDRENRCVLKDGLSRWRIFFNEA